MNYYVKLRAQSGNTVLAKFSCLETAEKYKSRCIAGGDKAELIQSEKEIHLTDII